MATAGKVRLGIRASAEGKVRTRLYRDTKWLGKNPLRRGQPVPWVLDVTFGLKIGHPTPPRPVRRFLARWDEGSSREVFRC